MRNGELETLLALGDGVCRPFDCGGVSSNGNFRARYFMDVNSPIKWQVDIALITQPSLRVTMTQRRPQCRRRLRVRELLDPWMSIDLGQHSDLAILGLKCLLRAQPTCFGGPNWSQR
jgi:hypothetical protein